MGTLLSSPSNETSISLTNQRLKSIPKSVASRKYPDLVFLDVSNNELKSLRLNADQFPNLETIVANHNKISSFPAEIESLQNLKKIVYNLLSLSLFLIVFVSFIIICMYIGVNR